ncbi:helix-turn-helix domain-containing protein [Paracoccaceae bacterium Fryx2]|nr:helix-turn-helix domain-containing protein [Paracoccaceae bacterium Fryx2]
MSSFRNVVSLSRGMEVLRAVNSDGRATVGYIHARTGFDKATIVRMLETRASTASG